MKLSLVVSETRPSLRYNAPCHKLKGWVRVGSRFLPLHLNLRFCIGIETIWIAPPHAAMAIPSLMLNLTVIHPFPPKEVAHQRVLANCKSNGNDFASRSHIVPAMPAQTNACASHTSL